MIIKIITWLVWAALVIGIALAIVYGLYLILVFWLFGHTFLMCLAIAGEVLLFTAYFGMCRLADAL